MVLASVAAALQHDLTEPELPAVRSDWNNRDHKLTTVLANEYTTEGASKNTVADDVTSDVVPDDVTSGVVFPKVQDPSFTDELIIRNSVPYVGNIKHDPHNEVFATEDGTVLLDIPDLIPKGKKKKAKNSHPRTSLAQTKVQQSDLFAQL